MCHSLSGRSQPEFAYQTLHSVRLDSTLCVFISSSSSSIEVLAGSFIMNSFSGAVLSLEPSFEPCSLAHKEAKLSHMAQRLNLNEPSALG